MGMGGKSGRLYGLPEPGQTDISSSLGVRCESRFLMLIRAVSPALRRPSGLEPDPKMDSFELNKILGAILATCLLLLVTSFTAGALFAPEMPAKPGYEIAVKDAGHGGGKEAAAAPAEPIEKLLQTASVEKGAAAAKKCAACHTFEKGGPNRVGPNLFGVVERARASEAGFNYSAAMKAKGGKWDFPGAQRIPSQSQGLRSRHRDGLRRHQQGQRARRRDRLSAFACGQAGSAADGVEVTSRRPTMGLHLKTARHCLAVLL